MSEGCNGKQTSLGFCRIRITKRNTSRRKLGIREVSLCPNPKTLSHLNKGSMPELERPR